VHALHAAAPLFHIKNTGLLRALLAYCTASHAVHHAKLRGVNGAERLTGSLEALANLQSFGVAYQHALKYGAAHHYGSMDAVLHIDDQLKVSVHQVLEEVYAALLGGPTQRGTGNARLARGKTWQQGAWNVERALRLHTAAVSIVGHSEASRQAEASLKQLPRITSEQMVDNGHQRENLTMGMGNGGMKV
jgi:hypothetical protein